MPDSDTYFAAFEATWPAAHSEQIGPFTYRDGAGGGSRVSAATLNDTGQEADLTPIEARFARDHRPPLFQIRDGQDGFDRQLDRAGYRIFDASLCLSAPIDALPEPDWTTTMTAWPPVALQREFWAKSGIGPERLAVMSRVSGPKTTLFSRIDQTPAGTCFVASHGEIAVLHALDVPPELRRNGIAARLIALAAHWAQTQGARTVAVQVTDANTAARALYDGLGFRHIARYHYRTKP